MSKRVADVLIETLQAAGVKRCYVWEMVVENVH